MLVRSRAITQEAWQALRQRLEALGYTDIETPPYPDINHGVVTVTYKGRAVVIGTLTDIDASSDAKIQAIVRDEVKSILASVRAMDAPAPKVPRQKYISVPLPHLADQQPLLLYGSTKLKKKRGLWG